MGPWAIASAIPIGSQPDYAEALNNERSVVMTGGKLRRTYLLVGGSSLGALMALSLLAAMALAQSPDTESEATAAAAVSCDIQELPIPDGAVMSELSDVSASGAYLGGRTTTADPLDSHATIWHAGQFQEIELTGEGQNLIAVNSAGDAIGNVFDIGTFRSWAYRDGTVTILPDGDVRDINDRGDIVGIGGDGTADRERPVVWPNGSDQAVELPLPDNAISGGALAIDDTGAIAGFYSDADGVNQAVVWQPDGTVTKLPRPTDVSDLVFVFATEINGNWILGEAVSPVGPYLQWNLSQIAGPERLGLDGAFGINPEGRIVGYDNNVAVLSTGAGIVALPTLGGNANNPDLARAISDDGHVIGGQSWRQNDLRAVQWTCQ